MKVSRPVRGKPVVSRAKTVKEFAPKSPGSERPTVPVGKHATKRHLKAIASTPESDLRRPVVDRDVTIESAILSLSEVINDVEAHDAAGKSWKVYEYVSCSAQRGEIIVLMRALDIYAHLKLAAELLVRTDKSRTNLQIGARLVAVRSRGTGQLSLAYCWEYRVYTGRSEVVAIEDLASLIWSTAHSAIGAGANHEEQMELSNALLADFVVPGGGL